MKNNVLIRVDGNASIGLGHLIRCKSLAGMIANSFTIHFVSTEMPSAIAKDLQYSGYQVTIIDTEAQFLNMVNPNEIVVLDGYDFGITLQLMIREKGAKLVIINDIPNDKLTADLIINHSPNVRSLDYHVLNKDCIFALGFDYAMLRPAFIEQARKIRNDKTIDSLLICFGGADKLNLTARAVIESSKFDFFKKINVVTGQAFEHIKSLQAFMANDSRFHHYVGVSDEQMRDLMLESEIAIIPTSGLLFEAIACKTRIIYGMYSDNQQLLYELVKEAGYGIDAVNFLSEDIYSAIERSSNNLFSRDTLFIDGQSPRRILQLFHLLLIKIRPAVWEDVETLFNWANDPDVRSNSIHQEPIIFEEHLEWFNRKMCVGSTSIFIMEYSGVPIGQVRYDWVHEGWLIDYSVDREYRGRGFGKKLIQQSLALIKKESVTAKVLNSNTASSKVFKSIGFLEAGTEKIAGREFDILSLNRN